MARWREYFGNADDLRLPYAHGGVIINVGRGEDFFPFIKDVAGNGLLRFRKRNGAEEVHFILRLTGKGDPQHKAPAVHFGEVFKIFPGVVIVQNFGGWAEEGGKVFCHCLDDGFFCFHDAAPCGHWQNRHKVAGMPHLMQKFGAG